MTGGAERGGVWLGDVLRALAVLRPSDGAGRRAVASGLGLHVPDADTEPPRAPNGPPVREPETVAAPARKRVEPVLEMLEPSERASGVRALAVDETAVPPPTPRELDALPRFTPLLHPGWSRGILAAVGETLVPDGPIDVDELVDCAARLDIVRTLPRRPRASLHRGLQLLVDIGEGMQPFRRDERAVVEIVRDVVGKTAVAVLYFRDCPTRAEGAGPGSVWTWEPYRPPEPRRPVLVLSDFGIGGPPLRPGASMSGEWLRLAQGLAQRGSQLRGLVPYPAARWPPVLRSAVQLIEWDRTTSRAAVRDALGRQSQ